MAEFTRELFLQALAEWGRYAEVFHNLPPVKQADFLKSQGYASMRDLLTHAGAWWEEAGGIIAETIKHGERAARKYDLAEFNVASLKRFQDAPEPEFIGWYESQRTQMMVLVSGLTDAQLQVERIQGWLDGVLLEHLKEHGIDAPRFLVVDMLQREWGGYAAGVTALNIEKQSAFLAKQGFKRFPDLLAHIITWWERGIAVIEASSSEDPYEVQDVDAFNAQAIERFSPLEEAQVLAQFEEMRLTMANLIDMLPDDVLGKPHMQSWLRADVIDHYYEHSI
jgi:hypothetical protein